MKISDPNTIAEAVRARHAELAALLGGADPEELRAPSRLEGWDRLTIVCHLRYGAAASHSITAATLEGRPASFYPGGRETLRPMTLQPAAGEDLDEVVASMIHEAECLDDLWAAMTPEDWTLVAQESEEDLDLGPIALGTLALLRLTEVEVHGDDLAMQASRWSDVFVDAALPARLKRLPTRRSNHRPTDHTVQGTWLLDATDGPAFLIGAADQRVTVEEVSDPAGADAVIRGTKRKLLAFLLGRLDLAELSIDGSRGLADSFHRAFPPP